MKNRFASMLVPVVASFCWFAHSAVAAGMAETHGLSDSWSATSVRSLSNPNDAGTAINSFFGTLAGDATWKGQASFTSLDEAGNLSSINVPADVTIHTRGVSRWSVGAMICKDNRCFFTGDEIQWNAGSLQVFRYDGNTMPATLIKATPVSLAYEFTDPYGTSPTHTVVHEEIRDHQFIRHTLIQVDGKIYEDYVFSVSHP